MTTNMFILIFLTLVLVPNILFPCEEIRGSKRPKSQFIFPNSSSWSLLISSHASNYNPDCNPWITGNGKKIFFISLDNFNGPPRQGYQGGWDIYTSELDTLTGQWNPAVNLGTNVNTPQDERRPSTNPQGDTLYFSRNGDIWMSTWNGTNWTPAVRLPSPINTSSNEYDPAISYDGKYLLFSSDNRPGGQGGADIWIARRTQTGWDSVTNLGPPVNTTANEHRAFLSADGQNLYFSDFAGSRGGGYGGDIWVSQKTGSGWTTPVLMPTPINSSRNTCSPSVSSDGRQFWTGGEGFEAVYGGDEEIWFSYLNSYPFPPQFSDSSKGWTRTAKLNGAWIVYSLVEGKDGSIYAATASHTQTGATGLIFKSQDKGASWSILDTLPGVQIVYRLLVLRNGALLAGTYPQGKIFKSTDNGLTWLNTFSLSGAFEVKGLYELKDGRLIAGVKGTSPGSSGIFVSTDSGNSFILLSNFPATEDFFEAVDGSLFASGTPYPAKSTNGGITWTFPSRDSFPFKNAQKRIECVTQTQDGSLYAGGWAHAKGGYVFKSTTNGRSWDTTGRIMTGQVHAMRVYRILPKQDGSIFIGFQPGPDSVVQQSTDGGLIWRKTGYLHGAKIVMSLLQASDGTLYAGTGPNGDVFKYTPTGVEEIQNSKLKSQNLKLFQNYPNPFSKSTSIRFQIPDSIFQSSNLKSGVSIKIYDIQGRLIREFPITQLLNYPITEFEFNGKDSSGKNLPSGIYFYRITSGSFTDTKRMILLR